MKRIATGLIFSISMGSVGILNAQDKQDSGNASELPDTKNNPGFRDDSTDASTGFSPLSGTPGTATTSGTGGLGTVKETAPIGTDIYTIERRDSIRKARTDSVGQIKKGSAAKSGQ